MSLKPELDLEEILTRLRIQQALRPGEGNTNHAGDPTYKLPADQLNNNNYYKPDRPPAGAELTPEQELIDANFLAEIRQLSPEKQAEIAQEVEAFLNRVQTVPERPFSKLVDVEDKNIKIKP